jgi:hypothetical protein
MADELTATIADEATAEQPTIETTGTEQDDEPEASESAAEATPVAAKPATAGKPRKYSQDEYQAAVSSQHNKTLLNVLKMLDIEAPNARSIDARAAAIESWCKTNASRMSKLQAERDEMHGELTKLRQEHAMLKAGVPAGSVDTYKKLVRGFMADDEKLTYDQALAEVIKVRPIDVKPINVITPSAQPDAAKPPAKAVPLSW